MKIAMLVISLLINVLMIGVVNFGVTRSQPADGTQTAIAGTISALHITQTAIINQTLTPDAPITLSSNIATLRVFVRGADGLLYEKVLINGSWSNWTWLEVPPVGISEDTPSAVNAPDGRVDLFVRGNDNALWHKTFWPDNRESEWESMGGELTSGPAAVGSFFQIPTQISELR
jgi:hypothetical protein